MDASKKFRFRIGFDITDSGVKERYYANGEVEEVSKEKVYSSVCSCIEIDFVDCGAIDIEKIDNCEINEINQKYES